MKIFTFIIFYIFFIGSVFSQSMTKKEVEEVVIDTAKGYMYAIGCVHSELFHLFAIKPYDPKIDDLSGAEYGVIWYGDIECSGGAGMISHNLVSVKFGFVKTPYVDVKNSSPISNFSTHPIKHLHKVVRSTKDSITIDGFADHPNGKDPNCCPSYPMRVLLKIDTNGNWKTVSEQVIKISK